MTPGGGMDPKLVEQEIAAIETLADHANLSTLARERIGDSLRVIKSALGARPAAAAAGDGSGNASIEPGVDDYDREAYEPWAPPYGNGTDRDAQGGADHRAKIVLRPIHEIVAEQRETKWLLPKIVEAHVIAVLAGARGSLKSFIGLDWAIRMAIAGHAGAILSGEGAGLDRRVAAWMQHHGKGIDLCELPLVALERALNLNVATELAALKEALAALPQPVAFIIIDTLSKFSAGLDENDNGEVASFLSGLSTGLRDAFNCSVLLIAHSGHGDTRRPRGASALMCNPDAEYIVDRPGQGMMVTVSRDRFKDTASLPPLAYTARVIDLGRRDSDGEPVTSLALDKADAPDALLKPKAGLGKNQERGLAALREWTRGNPGATHMPSTDLQELLKTHGVKDRNRRSEVIDFLVNLRVLTPAVGGHAVHPEALE